MAEKQALVVDDNARNMSVLCRLLEYEGMTPVQLLNSRELDSALNSVDNLQVIFLDLEMPHVDGYQILNQIKAEARFADVPVVAYTVHVSEIKVAHDRGFDGFIGKPLDSDKFPQQLARILSGDAVWETA